jgi:methanogenic corrinoid protein MtbC1
MSGMSAMKTQSELISAIADLNEALALKLIRQRLAENDDPLTLIASCQQGLQLVGERYAQHKYYLSGLIMGGEIFYEVMELVRPAMESRISASSSGKVLLGTVQSDIHDLGKNIVKLLLSCYKLTVYDLGVDVPPEEFLHQTRKLRPDIVGLSGLVTNAYDSMRETIGLFRQEGYQIPIVIGGSQLSKEVFQYTGADYWVNKADAGVKLILRLLK